MAFSRITFADSPFALPTSGAGFIACDTSAGAITLGLPESPSSAWIHSGRLVLKLTADSNAITLQPAVTDRVNDGEAGAAFILPGSDWSVPGSVLSWRLSWSGVAGLWIATTHNI